MKKILSITVMLLIVSLAFFSCNDREYSGVGPEYQDPYELTGDQIKLVAQGSGGKIDGTKYTLEMASTASSSAFAISFPALAAAYEYIIVDVEIVSIDSGIPVFTLKTNNNWGDIPGFGSFAGDNPWVSGLSSYGINTELNLGVKDGHPDNPKAGDKGKTSVMYNGDAITNCIPTTYLGGALVFQYNTYFDGSCADAQGAQKFTINVTKVTFTNDLVIKE